MRIFVTGAAGFIGAAFCMRLLQRGDNVFGVDNLDDYYDVQLKHARLNLLRAHQNFSFCKLDIADRAALANYFAGKKFDAVAHLAAMSGVAYSLENPAAYVDCNLAGFGNILEHCRHARAQHLLYASSSSVYGKNTKLPSSEDDSADHPLTLYAATKKANELMAHVYAHLYKLPCTGLRFATVYGPWGRPDMAFFKFANLMLRGESIPVYNRGRMTRDFIYIDDLTEGMLRALDTPAAPAANFNPAAPTPAISDAPHRVYNLGSGKQSQLLDCIHALESALGVKAHCEMLPMQPGDPQASEADMRAFHTDFNFTAATSIAQGLGKFAEWYREYYRGE